MSAVTIPSNHFVAMSALASIAMLIACAEDRSAAKQRSVTRDDTSLPGPVEVTALSPVPDDPPPPVAHLAHEVPQLEAKLAADGAYHRLWSDGRRTELNIFLTVVSDLLAEGGAAQEFTNVLRDKAVFDAAVNLYMIHGRIGRFPEAFATRVRQHVAAVSAEPNQGLWSAADAKSPGFDLTALAAWLEPASPSILRERIAAKDHGPNPWWKQDEPPRRPYLVNERAALDRLALLTSLTNEEAQRREVAGLPRVGDVFALGELNYKVTSAATQDAVGSGYGRQSAAKGATFYVVTYTVETRGKRTVRMLIDNVALVDAQGREFLPSSKASAALAMSGGKQDLLASEIQPGLPSEQVSAFEVPIDAIQGRLVLIVTENGLGRKGRAAVALATH